MSQETVIRDFAHVYVARYRVVQGDNYAVRYKKRWKPEGMPHCEYWAERESSILLHLAGRQIDNVVNWAGINRDQYEITTADAGRSLEDWLAIQVEGAASGVHPLSNVLDIAKLTYRLMLALGAIHGAGVIHGDLKADNLCIPEKKLNDGRWALNFEDLRVIDFTFALAKDLPLKVVLPTDPDAVETAYLPDELRDALRHDQKLGRPQKLNQMQARVDYYSLGFMLKQILNLPVWANPGQENFADRLLEITEQLMQENVTPALLLPQIERLLKNENRDESTPFRSHLIQNNHEVFSVGPTIFGQNTPPSPLNVARRPTPIRVAMPAQAPQNPAQSRTPSTPIRVPNYGGQSTQAVPPRPPVNPPVNTQAVVNQSPTETKQGNSAGIAVLLVTFLVVCLGGFAVWKYKHSGDNPNVDATPQEILAWYADAEQALRTGRKTEAFELYQKAAEAGHPESQNKLAWMYEKGVGVPKDEPQAVRWYQVAAESNLPAAQNNLAWMYENGVGVTQSYATARDWYLKAAEVGYLKSQNSVARMYQKLGQDCEAASWYQRAMRGNHPDAGLALAGLYEGGHCPEATPGQDQNVLAYELYRAAATKGNKDSMVKVGMSLLAGTGTAVDICQGLEWLEKAKRKRANIPTDQIAQLDITEETIQNCKTYGSPEAPAESAVEPEPAPEEVPADAVPE